MSSSKINADFSRISNRVGIGISQSITGMPMKNLTSDNGNTFSSGRQVFYALNSGIPQPLLTSADNAKFSKSGYNYLGARNMQTLQNGKPIPNNSSDLYIARKRNLAIGRGSTQNPSVSNPAISFNSNVRANLNTVTQARRSARNSGAIPSRQVANRPHNQARCC
jgi:hypothetical protein|tara:strand:+ start:6949 stop:7443 length:495 start_codon:yes stop_codon:yes gene_type:complete